MIEASGSVRTCQFHPASRVVRHGPGPELYRQEFPVTRHPESSSAAIKGALDIVAFIGQYLTLHRSGSKFKALCPWHDDRNPSLEINPERQSYRCWSCGVGGDIFDFVQNIEHVDFPEAKRMLAERAGIVLEGLPSGGRSRETGKAELLEVHAWAEDLFVRSLQTAASARDYLIERRLTPEVVERFRLGYAPADRGALMAQARRAGFGVDLLEQAGLVVTPAEGPGLPRERFRGRVMFPIRDFQGRTIGFGGRILPEVERSWAAQGKSVAKYLNSPETPLFQKRRNLYAADLARTAGRQAGWVAVVEGYTDVIAAHQAGIGNVVGTLGTALGEDHLAALRRLADRVVLIFDGDAAGQKAADRALELFLGHELDLRVLSLPGGLDPCDFLLREGADAFRELIDRAVDPLVFLLGRSRDRFDFGSLEGASRAAEWVLSILAGIPMRHGPGFNVLDMRLAKALDTLSHTLGIDVNTLRKKLSLLRKKAAKSATIRATPLEARGELSRPVAPPPGPGDSSPADRPSPPIHPADLDQTDREFIEILLNEPDAASDLTARVPVGLLRDAPLQAIYQVYLDLRDEGEVPGFERIVLRLDDPDLRSLAAGLLLPIDPGRFEDEVRPAPWSERLRKLVPAIRERERMSRIRDLRKALMEADVSVDSAARLALQLEYRRLLYQRPDTKSDAS
jgi:DNA primase